MDAKNQYKKLIGHKFTVNIKYLNGTVVEYTFGDFVSDDKVRIKWNKDLCESQFDHCDYKCEQVINMIKNDIWVVDKSYQREQKLKRLLK